MSLIVGQSYPVLIVIGSKINTDLLGNDKPYLARFAFKLPVYNHLHNDIENGQTRRHYHVDTRFIEKRISITETQARVYEDEVVCSHVGMLKLERINEYGGTSVHLIRKSIIKHHCIIKGRCPHRGYDLSKVEPIGRIIVCPLHKLQFDADTGKLITPLTDNKVDYGY